MKSDSNFIIALYTYIKNFILLRKMAADDFILSKIVHYCGLKLALLYILHDIVMRISSLTYPVLYGLSLFSRYKDFKFYFCVEPTLHTKFTKNKILSKFWLSMFGPATIDRKILQNAISAENLMREFEISEELMSRNISEKVLFEKYNIEDMRPMPYIKIEHTEVANTPGIRIIEVHKPLTPYPYVRYCFIKKIYDFQNIVFERSEVVNFYKIENQFDWITNALAEAQENILADIASMKNLLIENQDISSKHDDELTILLNKLLKSADKSRIIDEELLATAKTLAKNANLKEKIDTITTSVNTIIDGCLIKLEGIGDRDTEDAVRQIAKLLKLKRRTFEHDELYIDFFKIVENIFRTLSNKAKELSIVAEHTTNIIPKKYDDIKDLSYDEQCENDLNQIKITEKDFYALFSGLTNTRKPRSKRVTLDTVAQYWRILSYLHKFKGGELDLR
jgi:hypothetical protein